MGIYLLLVAILSMGFASTIRIEKLKDDGGIMFTWIGITKIKDGHIFLINKLNLSEIEEKSDWIKDKLDNLADSELCGDISFYALEKYLGILGKMENIQNLLGNKGRDAKLRNGREILKKGEKEINGLFGLDNEVAKYYEKAINGLQYDMPYDILRRGFQNEFKIINNTINDQNLKQNENNKAIEKMLKELIHREYIIPNETIKFQYISPTLGNLPKIELMITKAFRGLEMEVEQITNALLFLQSGLVHPLFITPEKIIEVLKTSEHVQELIVTPSFKNYHKLISSSKIEAYEKDKIITIIVSVPVLKKSRYFSYEVIPIPSIKDGKQTLIKSSFKYFTISEDKKYFEVGNDLLEYQLNKEQDFIRDDMNLRSTLDEESCELNTFMRRNNDYCEIRRIPKSIEYYKKLSPNKYVYIVSENTSYEYSCKEGNNETGKLQGAGYLVLENDCTFGTLDFLIKVTDVKNISYEKNVYIPVFEDCCRNIKIKDIKAIELSEKVNLRFNDNLNDLTIEIRNQKNALEMALEKVEFQGKSFLYGMSAIIITFGLIYVVITIFKKCFNEKKENDCKEDTIDTKDEESFIIISQIKENLEL